MPTISQCLQAIRQAVYGRDVREAIASGIEKCYSDVSNDITLAHNAAALATENAEERIAQAIQNAETATSAANTAAGTIEQTVAAQVLAQTGTVLAQLETALSAANGATSEANQAAAFAWSVRNAAEASIASANTAIRNAENATADAIAAKNNANTQAQLANQAERDCRQAISDLADMVSDADAATARANTATQNANLAVSQAVEAAGNADDAVARANTATQRANEATSEVTDIRSRLLANLEQDGEVLYGINDYGERITGPITGLGGGGGGSGGGSSGEVTVNTTLTMSGLTFPDNTTVREGSALRVQFTWSSLLDDEPTGNGTVKIFVDGALKITQRNTPQGQVTLDIGSQLARGSHLVRVQIEDIYSKKTYRQFDAEAVDLTISSTFDTSDSFTGPIQFRYTTAASINKVIHFKLDGTELDTVTTASHSERTLTIPEQSNGVHSLEVWYTAVLNGETIESNRLYYEFICIVAGYHDAIIASSFNESTMSQYSTALIDFKVYHPDQMTVTVEFYEDNVLKLSGTYNREKHSYPYNPETAGAHTVKIAVGNVYKEFAITVTPLNIDVTAETDGLELYLTAKGRSNSEQNPATWSYNGISASFSGMNWVSNGWMLDENNDSILRVSGGAAVTIPFQIFANDFRSSGKVISFELQTRNVQDYDAVVLSCKSGGRGISFTPTLATFDSEGSHLSMQYKDNEHLRLDFVVEKRSDHRFILAFINGKAAGVTQYPDLDDFAQVSPVGITIGSPYCWVDIYNIRIYSHGLLDRQILNNFIADTQNGSLKLQRYTRNQIFDQYGNVVPENLPLSLPYMMIEMSQLPQYKGDKKPCAIEYVDPLHPEKSFTATGVQANVQGTSSAKYPVKNLDLQFKSGFELNSGHADKYELDSSILPFNRFVLKADVASSEGANNVELVKLYCDFDPYKRPEEKANAKVRKGIWGRPIVCFQKDPDTGTVTFLGKYNFNLPKRAPGPYGYSGDMESWEFENNTSDLMLFLSDVFDETLVMNQETGEMVPKWTLDFEARFPDDTLRDYSRLRELVSFVVSTNRAAATNGALSESVTYEGVTYTTDSAAYRLAKFRAEFPSYAELQSFLFYYIFTDWYLMVDSRAKNLFIGFSGGNVTAENRLNDRKAIAEPYDMDTAIGTNNEGSLVFGYALEDTDHLTGGANVYNGQNSVLWNNIRDAYPAELAQTAKTIASAGFTYAEVERRFEEHQAAWPEAVWNEDFRIKYLNPLIAPAAGKTPTAEYLPMGQGSKEMQRKHWLYYRFKNRNSKWNSGEALSDVIQLRGYAKADITITPYTDIYPTVVWASTYLTQERGTHNVPTTLHCPLDAVNDTEIYIHSASQVKSVGDLSGLKAGFCDISSAVNLQDLKVGDSDNSYENQNLLRLGFGANRMLKTVDARNCTALGTGDQKTIDMSTCPVLEEAYFEGTGILGVSVPNGGVVKKLHLPSTITTLTLMNQPGINDLVAPTSNLTTLWIENCPTVNTKSLLSSTPANARVRLINVNWTATDAAEIETILTKLDTMRGLDENGNSDGVTKAQISGNIHTSVLSGDDISGFEAHGYPFLTFTADQMTVKLTFKSEDGGTTLGYKNIAPDGNGSYNGNDTGITRPGKTTTDQYTYSFSGWSLTPGGSANANALTGLTSNRTVYAAYTATVRSYTITFATESGDGGSTLQSSSYQYGATPAYSGPTPTTTKGDASSYPFQGWTPAITAVTGNQTYYAVFGSPVEVAEINDSWATIFEAMDNGTFNNTYKVGNYKAIDLGTEGSGNVQFVAKNADPLAAGGGNAPVSCVVKFALNTSHRMNASDTAEGGWTATEMRQYLLNTIWPKIPQEIRDRIVPVTKYTYSYQNGSLVNNVATTETIYLLSEREVYKIGSQGSQETSGPDYTAIFSDAESRKMYKPGASSASNWWLRSAFSSERFFVVGSNGRDGSDTAHYLQGVVIGFCLGTSEQVRAKAGGLAALRASMQAGTYATDYAPGDLIPIDNDGENSANYVQILGFNKDELADGSGNMAKVSAAYYYALPNTRRMNPSKVANTEGTGALGGWEKTEMRTYLRETLYPKMDSDLKSMIVPVKKYTRIIQASDETAVNNVETTETVYLLSDREVFGSLGYETMGPIYSDVFTNIDTIKRINRSSMSYDWYWLRSANSATGFRSVSYAGSNSSYGAYSSISVVVGFCLDVPTT